MAQIILDSNNNLIQGDFDNATLNNRTKLQTTTTNATTNVYVVPNGSSTSAGVSVANNSSLTNASKIVMATNGSTDTQIISGVNGSGSYLPLSFYTNNALAMQITTAGNVGIGTTPTNGRLVVNGNIIPSGAPSTYWGIDYAPVDGTGNSFVTLAYGATYDLAPGSGIVFVMENSSNIGVLMAQVAYGGVYIVSDPSARYSPSVNTASKVNLYYNPGTGTYRLQNYYSVGVSYNFWIATIRVRATS
jgi:hypothetical protein